MKGGKCTKNWCGWGLEPKTAWVSGVDVVDGEEDGLAATPEDLAEELARVKLVGEGDREQ